MIAKVYFKNGAVEMWETQPQGYLELGATCYWEDDEGLHLGVGTYKQCTRDCEPWEGNKPTSKVILPREYMEEVDHVAVDGKIVWFDRPPVDANVKQMLEDNRRLFMAYMQDKKEAKKSFDSLREIDSVDDLLNG